MKTDIICYNKNKHRWENDLGRPLDIPVSKDDLKRKIKIKRHLKGFYKIDENGCFKHVYQYLYIDTAAVKLKFKDGSIFVYSTYDDSGCRSCMFIPKEEITAVGGNLKKLKEIEDDLSFLENALPKKRWFLPYDEKEFRKSLERFLGRLTNQQLLYYELYLKNE